MAKSRLGDNPLEEKDKMREGLGMAPERQVKKTKKKHDEYEEEIRKEVKQGRAKNYYISKHDELVQKITIHLPYETVTQLKKEAVDKRVTLSELIRGKLREEE